MLAARATGSVRNARPAAALAVAASRAAPRAFSAKPDKPVPTPEEEAEKQAAQMRALDIVLDAQNKTGECERRCLGCQVRPSSEEVWGMLLCFAARAPRT